MFHSNILRHTSTVLYSKSPTCKPSSCELLKMWTCVPSTSDMSDIAACPPLPVADEILQLYHLPPSFPPPVSSSSSLFTQCQPLYASCSTTLLYFSRYYTIRSKIFSLSFVFVMYYLCEKYHKPITVQYYIADRVCWVSRLTLLDLRTNWT